MNNEHEELGGQVILSNSASSEASKIGSTPEEAQPITSSMFSDFISKRNTLFIRVNGDGREKDFEETGLLKKFPNYEEVWRLLITPATNRLYQREDYSIRSGISDEVLLMCQFHYTVMSATLRAKKHMDSKRDGSFFDFFCSMQNASEQVELFMLTHQIVVESKFSWPDLLTITDNLKSDPKRLELLVSEFAEIIKEDWSNFKSVRGEIAAMRNALAHGPEIATYTSADGNQLHPRISKHKELLWIAIPETEKMEQFFKKPEESMKSAFDTFMARINNIWSYFCRPEQEDKMRSKEVMQRYGVSSN